MREVEYDPRSGEYDEQMTLLFSPQQQQGLKIL